MWSSCCYVLPLSSIFESDLVVTKAAASAHHSRQIALTMVDFVLGFPGVALRRHRSCVVRCQVDSLSDWLAFCTDIRFLFLFLIFSGQVGCYQSQHFFLQLGGAGGG